MSSPLLGTITASLPWAAMYAGIFVASRVVGQLFPHYRALSGPDKSYWAESVVSTVNACLLSVLSWQTCVELDYLSFGGAFTRVSALSTLCCHAMSGYTLWDSFPLIVYRKEWGGFAMYCVHHFFSLIAWGLSATLGVGHNVVVPLLLCEATGPFTNGRWFLSKAGLKDSNLYVLNALMMALSFFVLRVVLNFRIFADMMFNIRGLFAVAPFGYAIAMPPMYLINIALQLMWFQKIVSGLLAFVRGGGSDKKGKAK